MLLRIIGNLGWIITLAWPTEVWAYCSCIPCGMLLWCTRTLQNSNNRSKKSVIMHAKDACVNTCILKHVHVCKKVHVFCMGIVCLFLIYTVLCIHLLCTNSLHPNTSHLLADWCQRGSSSSPLSKLWMRPGNYSQISQLVMGQRTVNCSCNGLGLRGRHPNKVKNKINPFI